MPLYFQGEPASSFDPSTGISIPQPRVLVLAYTGRTDNRANVRYVAVTTAEALDRAGVSILVAGAPRPTGILCWQRWPLRPTSRSAVVRAEVLVRDTAAALSDGAVELAEAATGGRRTTFHALDPSKLKDPPCH